MPYYMLDADRKNGLDANGNIVPGYQSEALQVVCGCVQAGCLGGYAAYVHACDVAGLVGIIPESASDATSGNVWTLPPVTVSPDDVTYWRYFAEVEPYTLRALTPGTLRNPGMVGLFTNVLERLLTTHQVMAAGGTGAYGVLRDLARVFRTSNGKYGIPQGTYTAHVLASIQHVALQAYVRYADDGRLLDEYLADGSVLVGLLRYLERLDTEQNEYTAARRAWAALHRSVPEWLPYRAWMRRKQADRDILPRLAVTGGHYVVTSAAVKPTPRIRHVSQLNNARMRKAKR